MGFWNITINGIGAHHNDANVNDADRVAKSFVKSLKAAGHQIVNATFNLTSLTENIDPPGDDSSVTA